MTDIFKCTVSKASGNMADVTVIDSGMIITDVPVLEREDELKASDTVYAIFKSSKGRISWGLVLGKAME